MTDDTLILSPPGNEQPSTQSYAAVIKWMTSAMQCQSGTSNTK